MNTHAGASTWKLVTALVLCLGLLGGIGLSQSPEPTDVNAILKIPGGGRDAVDWVSRKSTDQQAAVLESVVRRVQAVRENENLSEYSEAVDYVRSAAWLLGELGTDKMVIEAFGNLSRFGTVEEDAALALATCQGPEGVTIVAALARSRLPHLGHAIDPNTEEDRNTSNDVLLPFYRLLKALKRAHHQSGPKAYDMILKDLVALYDSPNGKLFVSMIGPEIGRGTAPHRRTK